MKHAFVSGKAALADITMVDGPKWNAAHVPEAGDYDAFYLKLAGGTMTGALEMTSGFAINWNGDVGISRVGAASLAVGNGTAGDASGTMKAANFQSGADVFIARSGFGTVNIGSTAGAQDGEFNARYIYLNNGTNYTVTLDSVLKMVELASAGRIGWSASADASASPDAGISRLGTASLALGNGTAGDFTGTLKLTTLNAITGVQINSAATSGNVLRGNGTNFVSSAIQPGDVIWSGIANATADLTLANATYNTTFDQTAAVNWTWANTTAAVSGGLASIALVSKGTAAAAGTNPVTINTTGATLLVAMLYVYGSSAATISDNQSNSWNYLTTYVNGSAKLRIAYAYGITTNATHTFTVAASGMQYSSGVAFVYAFSGTKTDSTVFDVATGTSTAQTSPFQTGSITPALGDVVIAGFGVTTNGAPASIDSGFSTADVASDNSGAAYLLSASGSSLNPTWTVTNSGGGAVDIPTIAAFKAGSAAGATPQLSPIIHLNGTYWNGSASATDSWTLQNVLASLTNGSSLLTFSHTGTSGTAAVSVPGLVLSATLSPASSAAGIAGQVAYDASYIYVCTASGTWKRAALTGGY